LFQAHFFSDIPSAVLGSSSGFTSYIAM